MKRGLKSRISVFGLVLILIFFSSGIVGFAVGDQMNQSGQNNESYRIGNGFINGEGEVSMNSLITLLQEMGLDISYGQDGGTVFSMVDQSLTRIITDLSSGNTNGFMDIPLINETLNYLGISPDDIIVRPEDVSPSMAAIDRYNERYSTVQNNSGVV
ncbi:MAG: hypothetical protein V1862_09840 [Methanobacteriota archaeon]